MTKINSNNIIKSPQDLGCICGAHHCVSISQLLRLLGAPAKPENLECRWISLWDSLPLGPAVAMNSLMMPPPGIPPHLTPPPQKSWHCNSHKSLLSWLGLKKIGKEETLKHPLGKGLAVNPTPLTPTFPSWAPWTCRTSMLGAKTNNGKLGFKSGGELFWNLFGPLFLSFLSPSKGWGTSVSFREESSASPES